MDFTLTEDQQAMADLAHRILSERLPPERLRELEQSDPWFADDVWAELGDADLLGIALPEAVGGGGYGILEACLIAEQVGRTVAPVPYLMSIVGAAMPVAHFGSDRPARGAAPRCHRRNDHPHDRALRARRCRRSRHPVHPGDPGRRRLAPRR